MQVLWRGNANAWECDELGHLNVRFYIAKAWEAVAGLADQLGMHQAFAPRACATLVLRDTRLRFLAEARPGAPLTVRGGVLNHDASSAVVALILEHAGSAAPAATFELTLDHADPQTGKVFAWPARLHTALQSAQIDRPDVLTTRSLSTAPPLTTKSSKQADTLNLQEIGRGRINPDELDAFNRMRVEFAIGKISNSVNQFSDGFPEQWAVFTNNTPLTVSSAVLEARLAYHRLPRMGEGYVIRSGLKSATEKVRTLVHWALDPVTGQPLWSMEAVACMLNLQTRRLEPATPDMLAHLQARLIPDLAL